MDGKVMVRYIVFTLMGFVCIAQANAVSDQGSLNKQTDSILFQNKCASCHTVGLISWGPDLLPSDIWKMVGRMANYQGANIHCCADRQNIYLYIVDYVAKNRAAELEQALDCLPDCYREYEQQLIDQAKSRYE
jgi:hypothetical protein